MTAPTVALPVGYYRDNFRFLLAFVVSRYEDLLSPDERDYASTFDRLTLNAQRLYVRLVGRKGPLFRVDKLVYDEISVGAAIEELASADLIDFARCEAAETLLSVFTRRELAQRILRAPKLPLLLVRGQGKLEGLEERMGQPRFEGLGCAQKRLRRGGQRTPADGALALFDRGIGEGHWGEGLQEHGILLFLALPQERLEGLGQRCRSPKHRIEGALKAGLARSSRLRVIALSQRAPARPGLAEGGQPKHGGVLIPRCPGRPQRSEGLRKGRDQGVEILLWHAPKGQGTGGQPAAEEPFAISGLSPNPKP